VASPFVFMDLRTTDLDRSRRFYSELFGWVVTDVPAGPATVPMFTGADDPWGGFTELGDDDQRQPQWIPYAPVTDLGAAVERAVQLGATVVRQRVDLPQGSVAVVTDPGGATVALWEPAPATRP
jgi:uncharacterized protein